MVGGWLDWVTLKVFSNFGDYDSTFLCLWKTPEEPHSQPAWKDPSPPLQALQEHPWQLLQGSPHPLPALTFQGAWAHPGKCHRASSHSSCQCCGSCALPGKRHSLDDAATVVRLPVHTYLSPTEVVPQCTPKPTSALTFQVVLSLFMWLTRSLERGG